MEKANTQVREKVYTKSVHIYPAERSNCGVIPDEDGIIFHFGETKKLYPPKYIKILVNYDLNKNDFANSLRKLADILEGKKEIKYEDWYNELTTEN